MTPTTLKKKLMTASRCARWVFEEVIEDCDLEDMTEYPEQFEDIRDTLINDCSVWIAHIESLKRTLSNIESYEQLMKGDFK